MVADRDINQHLTAVMVVIDVYPQMMREMIANKFPPQYAAMLIQNDSDQILMNNITSQQKKMVKKLNTDGYNALDLSCLYKVIRHCKLIRPPNQGWGNMPNPEDQSEGDDVERMKRHRNDILHRPRGGLSVSERDYFFQQSIEMATRMDIRNGSPQNGFEYRIDKIKTEIVRAVSLNKYIEALENLTECKEKLHEKGRPCIFLYYGNKITKKIGTQYDQEDIKTKEVTVALIKPNVVEEGKVDKILEDIKEAGIEILHHKERQLTEDEIRHQFYTHLQNQHYFDDLVQFMTSGPSHVLVLTKGKTGENIIENFRDLIGPTDVEEAKTHKPESLRAKYGQRTFMNAVHGSSSLDMAKRELALFFPDFVAPAVEGKAVKLQTTLALVRPEAVRLYKGNIMAKIRESGFQVAMQKEIHLTREMVEEFYEEYQGQEYFDQLIKNMTSGPVLALGLLKEDAIEEWRNILGPKKVNRAKEEAPDSLRAQFAVDDEINSLHGSSSEESAEKELKLFFPVEQTVAVIKPDAIRNKKEIVNRIRAACFRIAATKTIKLSDEVAKKFYSSCEYKDYYNDLIDHMKSGETYFMGLCREGAVEGWRSMIGPSDPIEAKKVSPNSIRATYGESILKNAVHGSSDPEHAKRTIKTIFGDRSCSCTIVLRDSDIDGETVLQIKNFIMENMCKEDIELIDIEHGSLILHVTIPDWCFMTKEILHERMYTFLNQFFLVASIPCTHEHSFTVVLAESDALISDNELTNADEIDYLKEKTFPVLKLSVNIKHSAFQDEFVMNRFFSGMYNAIDRNNIPVNGSAREVLMLAAIESDENFASSSDVIQDPQLRMDQEQIVSELESNYFKISTLLLKIAPRAVRIKFDDTFPPDLLKKTLSLNHKILTDLKTNRCITQVQWNAMFPGTGDPTSQLFDTTLMICLFRNLGGIQISNQVPPRLDINFEADLSRLIICRKDIVNYKDRAFTNANFTAYWNETEAAVIRLSSGILTGECDKLKTRTYYVTDRKNTLYNVQAGKRLAQIENLNEVVDRIEKINSKQTFEEKQDCFEKVVEEWEEERKWFVPTNAFNFIIKNLDKRVLAVVGNPGIGKSMLLHQTAIHLRDTEGYSIIPCHSPSDIVKNFTKETKQVFIFDDVCGKFTLVQAIVDQWNVYEISILRILQRENSIILVSCRSQVFRQKQCRSLFIFLECFCDLNDDDCATDIQEKLRIAKQYLSPKTVSEIKPKLDDFGMFPLLCRLYREREHEKRISFFQDPFNFYKDELDGFETEEGEIRCCSLFLCVLHNGCLNQAVLMEESESEFSQTLETIFANFKLNPLMSRQRMLDSLETLLNTYLTKRNDVFHVLHDRLFDFLCYYFGQRYQQLIINYADSEIIRDRTLLKSLRTSPQEFTILIDTKYENAYFDRLIFDMLSGYIDDVLHNHQIRFKDFRVKFLSRLKELDDDDDDVFVTRVLSEFVTDENGKSSQLLPVNFACKYGYTELFDFFLSKTKDVNAYEGNNIPLIIACRKGDKYMTGLLLEKGADVNQKDSLGCSPLLWSCVYGNLDIIQMLLHNKADIENIDVCSMSSPLTWACFGEFIQYCESADLEKKLLSSGHANEFFSVAIENINYQFFSHERIIEMMLILLRDGNSKGIIFIKEHVLLNTTPKVTSALKKLSEVFEGKEIEIENVSTRIEKNNPTQPFTKIMNLFLDKGVDIDKPSKCGLTALCFACNYCSFKGSQSINYLLSKGASVNIPDIDGIFPLHIAIYAQKGDLVKLLIEKGSFVNCSSRESSPLLKAVDIQNISITETLIQHGADINYQFENGVTLLHHAIQFNNVDLINTLLKGGISVNCQNNIGDTPLLIAVNLGLPNIVDFLIKGGADVNTLNSNKTSPLMHAVSEQNISIADTLIQHGADINLLFDTGATLLHRTIELNDVDLIKKLLKGGISVNCQSNSGDTPLLIAVNHGLQNIVDFLIKEGADVNTMNSDKISPLMLAVFEQNISIADSLIQRGADINIRLRNGSTLIHYAIHFNNVELINILLKGGLSVNCQNNNGDTALLIAVNLGLPNIVDILIKNGATVNTWNSDKRTPLMIASANGDHNIVEMILKRKLEFTAYQNPAPLFSACRNNHLDVVSLLLKYGCDINSSNPEYGNTCLLEASYEGFESMVALLLSKGANVDASNRAGDFPLTVASMNGHDSIVRLLIEKGADMYMSNKNGENSLILACLHNHLEVVKVFIENGCNIESFEKQKKQTCLSVASYHAYDKIVSYLIKHGANVNTKSYIGNTPLMLAASKGHSNIVHMLIKHKAGVNIRNEEGSTSLSLASSKGLDKIVAYLIEHGANVNTQNNIGTTPLILATSKGHLNIVKILIENKADVNIQNEKGSTCLSSASSKGFDNIVIYLIYQRASIDTANNTGDSPLMLATKNGHASTVKILLQNGAKMDIRNKEGLSPSDLALKFEHSEIADILCEYN